MELHQTHVLADGRILGYADLGAPGHFPVFYFHGFLGSRLEAAFADPIVNQCGVRLLAVERPGYGLSTYQPARQIKDWPNDIEQLANALGLERFSVLGISNGGIYALACAHALPQRVYCIGIASTPAPLHQTDSLNDMAWLPRNVLTMITRYPRLGRRLIGQLYGNLIKHHPHWIINGLLPGLCERDRQTLNDEIFQREFTQSIKEAYHHGYAGPFHDLSLVAKDWGFKLESIQDPVHLWHGKADTIIPAGMGHRLKARLPNCRTYFAEGEGHFSIITNFMNHALLTLKNRNAGDTPIAGSDSSPNQTNH